MDDNQARRLHASIKNAAMERLNACMTEFREALQAEKLLGEDKGRIALTAVMAAYLDMAAGAALISDVDQELFGQLAMESYAGVEAIDGSTAPGGSA
jgi:hypothetical protein